MSTPRRLRAILLEDTPALEDEFATSSGLGPHKRVATAITNLVATEKGGKVIGLEGGWGAGKSTVANFVRRDLDDIDNFEVLSFDAWAHEGDPLRRTYLEAIIDRFQELSWVDKEQWDKVLDTIANRRRETSTRTIPHPTRLGAWLGISLLPIPFGTALVTAAVQEGVTIGWGLPPSWSFIVGTLFSLSPVIVLLVNVISIWRQKKKLFALEEWSFLQGQAITETTMETVETPNPTSNEFEKHFGDLMTEALGNNDDRKLLLILDNLDRVDPEVALEIWSTLQTFLQEDHHRKKMWFSRLWVLVPYDPHGLRRLWDSRTDGGSSSEDKEASRVSESFLDKSFQIRFQVPPPVLSNWQSFLYKLVEKALPDHSEKDRHMIYRVYEHCRGQSGQPPTPRQLKLYVNQIGAVVRQWQAEFPVGHVAYYVLNYPNQHSVPERLLKESERFPSQDALTLLGDTLTESLAGLAFNVEANVGQQLLLGEPIYSALSKGNAKSLKRLEDRYGDGFWVVAEKVATTKFNNTDASTIAKAGLALADSGITSNSRAELVTVVNAVCAEAKEVQNWSPFAAKTANGVSALCRLKQDENFSKQLTSSIIKALGEQPGVDIEKSSAQPSTVLGPVMSLVETLISLRHQAALETPFPLDVDAEGWVLVCNQLVKKNRDGRIWKYFSPKLEPGQIMSATEGIVDGGKFTNDHLQMIRVTCSIIPGLTWGTVVTKIGQRLDASQSIALDESYALLSALCELRKQGSSEAQSALKALADDGHTLHQLHQAKSSNHQEAIAVCMYSFLRERPAANKPAVAGDSEAGHKHLMDLLSASDAEIAKRLLAEISRYDERSFLFNIADKREDDDALIVECLRQIADGDSPEDLFEPSVVIKRWKMMRSELGSQNKPERFAELIKHLARSTDLGKSIREKDGGFDADASHLYYLIVDAEGDKNTKFSEWCRMGLQSLDTDTWMLDFSGRFETVGLLTHLCEHGMNVELSTSYQDALEQHAKSVLDGKHAPSSELGANWSEVVEALRVPGLRKVLKDRLIEAAAQRHGRIPAIFFKMYGTEIADSGALLANGHVVSNLFSRLVGERNVQGIQWLIKLFQSDGELLKKFSVAHAVDEFERRIRESATESEDDAQPLIQQLAETLGFDTTANEECAAEDDDVEAQTPREEPKPDAK